MKPLRSVTPRPEPAQAASTPRRYPRLVFATEDRLGAEKGPDAPTRILIVEDDFLVAFQVESALTEAGYQLVGTAASSEEAVALAIAERPTLIIMDVRLASQRDGVDTALELFRDHGLRCIFATAHSDEEVRNRAKPAEPLGWLQKPYTMVSLIELVAQALATLGKRP